MPSCGLHGRLLLMENHHRTLLPQSSASEYGQSRAWGSFPATPSWRLCAGCLFNINPLQTSGSAHLRPRHAIRLLGSAEQKEELRRADRTRLRPARPSKWSPSSRCRPCEVLIVFMLFTQRLLPYFDASRCSPNYYASLFPDHHEIGNATYGTLNSPSRCSLGPL